MFRCLLSLVIVSIVAAPCSAQDDDFFGSNKTKPKKQITDGTIPMNQRSFNRLVDVINGMKLARAERQELKGEIAAMRRDRDGLLKAIRDLRETNIQGRKDRKGILQQLADAKAERQKAREEAKEAREAKWKTWREERQKHREEMRKTMGPIRQGIYLLTNLVWSLVALVGVLALLLLGLKVWELFKIR